MLLIQERKLRTWLLIVTAIYLILELSFSARLLDILGSQFNEDIHGIEIYGRIFSGLALSLLFFNYVFSQEWWSAFRKAATAAVILVCSISFMWWLQNAIIDKLESRYDGADRVDIAYLSMSAGMIAAGSLEVPGLSREDLDKAPHAGKAFVAIYPYLYHNGPGSPGIGAAQPDRHSDAILTYQVTVSCELGESNPACLGTHEDFHERIWLPAREKAIISIQEKIDQYQYLKSDEAAQSIGEKGWELFSDQHYKKLGWRPGDESTSWFLINKFASNQARKNIIKEYGLPANWQYKDKNTFIRAVGKKEANIKRKEFEKDFEKEFGVKVPSNPSLEWGFNLARTQTELNKRFGIEIPAFGKQKPKIRFPYHSTELKQTEKLYQSLVNYHKSRIDPDAGLTPEVAKNHLDRMVIPVVALLFSMIGGLLHIIKFFVVASGFFTARLDGLTSFKYKASIAAGLFSIFLFVPMIASNAVTRSEAYTGLVEHIRQSETGFKPGSTYAISWLLNAQQIVYPVNNAIRVHMLRGVRFDKRIELLTQEVGMRLNMFVSNTSDQVFF